MAYTPASSLIFWLKADADVYKDTTPTACSNNDPVALWKNQASTGVTWDVVQSTAARQPTYLTSQVNGVAGVSFDRNELNYLETSGAIAHGLGTGKFLVAIVTKMPSTLDTFLCPFSIGAYAPAFYICDASTPKHPQFYLTTGVSFTDITPAISTTYLTLFDRNDPSGTTIHAWNAEIGSNPTVSSVTPTDAASIATGIFRVGWDSVSNDAFIGLICEIMLFDGSYTTTDKTNAINYLNEKYAGTSPPATEGSAAASMMDF